MIIDLIEVWRDKKILGEIRAEVRRQSQQKWKPWEILLPPELLYPMIEEVSHGMYEQWSPVIDGIGIQVGTEGELGIRFVLPDMTTSPVMLQTMKYIPERDCDIIPIEVNHGNKIRV